MCTLVVLNRPGLPWPMLLAANRDEMSNRPWLPPGRHWHDRPDIVAGKDKTAGGSWLGINAHGVAAAMLNRFGTLGPAEGKRSRGELVLEALDNADAAAAALVMSELEPRSYRPFNMVVADNRDAFFIAHRGEDQPVAVARLPEGLTMLTSREPNDVSSPRIAHYRPLFLKAQPPDPDKDEWAEWEKLLASTERAAGEGEEGAMSFLRPNGFGTVSGALIALPNMNRAGVKPRFRFAAGPPDKTPFQPVGLA